MTPEMKMEELEKCANLLYKRIDNPFNGFGIYGVKIFNEINRFDLQKIDPFGIDCLFKDADIYDAIQSLYMDKQHTNYNRVIFCTSGWAAPMNNDDSDFIPPSKAPGKKRVCASVVLDIDNKNISGTFLRFQNEDEVMYEDEARGLLADTILKLVK
jgi:hypothetical protein